MSSDTRKQVEQGWGAGSGEKAWDDERQGENIAKEEESGEPQTPGEEAEEADKAKSYSDYLAEKAARDSLAAKPVRSANEGTKEDKKWANAKELKHDNDEDSYIKGTSEKTKREKQRKEKTYLDVDLRYVEQPRSSPSSGGRGGRGGRGGDRARGDRTPRGPRGGAPRGGPSRGGRGGARTPAGPTVDEKNFPTLGGN